MEKIKVLAVQLPAPCSIGCAFCRIKTHNVGDPKTVFSTILSKVDDYDEVYLTSNGETGKFKSYHKLIPFLLSKNKKVSILCATPESILPGLTRIEISMNKYTKESAELAIKKAKEYGIPFTLSLVASEDDKPKLIEIGNFYGAHSVLLRALQKEGHSDKTAGKTELVRIMSSDIGTFPVNAYPELSMFDNSDVTCINEYGNIVQYLGDQKAVA